MKWLMTLKTSTMVALMPDERYQQLPVDHEGSVPATE